MSQVLDICNTVDHVCRLRAQPQMRQRGVQLEHPAIWTALGSSETLQAHCLEGDSKMLNLVSSLEFIFLLMIQRAL